MDKHCATNPDFKIDLKNPEKMFTNKQLWDAFVDAQTKLDHARELLRRTHEHLLIANSKGYGCGPLTDEIETFLKEIES